MTREVSGRERVECAQGLAEALGPHVYWVGPDEVAELVARDFETARRLAEGR